MRNLELEICKFNELHPVVAEHVLSIYKKKHAHDIKPKENAQIFENQCIKALMGYEFLANGTLYCSSQFMFDEIQRPVKISRARVQRAVESIGDLLQNKMIRNTEEMIDSLNNHAIHIIEAYNRENWYCFELPSHDILKEVVINGYGCLNASDFYHRGIAMIRQRYTEEIWRILTEKYKDIPEYSHIF